MRDVDRLDALAGVLAYPEADFAARLDRCRDLLAGAPSGVLQDFRRFSDGCNGRSLEDLQELYTRTFDMNPDSALEIGWHLFGENYARGEFLVDMRRDLRSHGIEESPELPDHLVHVLPVVARMEPGRVGAFVAGRVLPALDRILASLTGRDCPYEDLLRTVRAVVEEARAEAAKESGHE